MTKIGIVVGLAVVSFGPGALAQAPATPQSTPTAAAELQAPPPAPAVSPAPETPSPRPPQTKTPDVVVTGKRLPDKPCGERDTACLTAVAAEAWRLYPKKVDAFCVREQWRLQAQRLTGETLLAGNGIPSDTTFDSAMPAAEKILCDYPKTKH
jgi:hypothetical protein